MKPFFPPIEYIEKTKVCRCCGIEQPYSEFTWNRSMPDNKTPDCRACISLQEYTGEATIIQASTKFCANSGIKKSEAYKMPQTLESQRLILTIKNKANEKYNRTSRGAY